MVRHRLVAALCVALLCLPVVSVHAAGASTTQEPRSAHRQLSPWQQLLLPLLEALGVTIDPNGILQDISCSGILMDPNGSSIPGSAASGETSDSGLTMDPDG
jgi:hypothetical protein